MTPDGAPLIGWNREVNGEVTSFGVSGLLYNTNLIPYDRKTDSNWSQMLLQSVNGPQMGTDIETHPLLETTWATWKERFPDSQVMNMNTGYNRDYSRYPYGSYKTNHELLLFPISVDDGRLPRKERGLGLLVDGQARFYPLRRFPGQAPVVVQESYRGVDLVIIGNKSANYIAAYHRQLPDGTRLEFSPREDESGIFLDDQLGNAWDLFGIAVEGPMKGASLPPTQSFVGYWFAWAAFYPSPSIY